MDKQYNIRMNKAATMLGITTLTLKAWCASGMIEHIRLPKKDGTKGERRFSEEDLKAFKDNRMTPRTVQE